MISDKNSATASHRGSRGWLAVALVVLASLLLPLSLLAVWLNQQVRETDSFVDTVAPLSYNEAVADALSQELADSLFEQLDVRRAIEDVLPQEAGFLAGPLSDRLHDYTRDTARDIILSDSFHAVWVQANRAAHGAVTALVLGEGDTFTSSGGQVVLDLNPAVDRVRSELGASGIDIFDQAPSDRLELKFILFQSQILADIQGLLGLLQRLARILPFLVPACWAAALWLSRDRRRTLAQLGAGTMVSMAALALLLGIVRDSLIGSAAAADGSAAAAAALYDTFLRTPRTALRWLFMAGLAVSFFAWFAWPAGLVGRYRRAALKWLEAAADSRAASNLLSWISANRWSLQLGGLVAALLIFIWLDWPGLTRTLALLALLLLYLALVEALARLRSVLHGYGGAPPRG